MTEPPTIYAFTGAIALFSYVRRWHQEGADPDRIPKGENEWTLIVIDADGISGFTNDVPYRAKFAYPMTFGAGEQYALGAMHAGASPERAVEIAAICNIRTRGPVQVVDIEKTLHAAGYAHSRISENA